MITSGNAALYSHGYWAGGGGGGPASFVQPSYITSYYTHPAAQVHPSQIQSPMPYIPPQSPQSFAMPPSHNPPAPVYQPTGYGAPPIPAAFPQQGMAPPLYAPRPRVKQTSLVYSSHPMRSSAVEFYRATLDWEARCTKEETTTSNTSKQTYYNSSEQAVDEDEDDDDEDEKRWNTGASVNNDGNWKPWQ